MLLVVFSYCRIKRTTRDIRIPKQNMFLFVLSLNILIVGEVEESQHHVSFLSLQITIPLDVYSEVSTTAHFRSFSGK